MVLEVKVEVTFGEVGKVVVARSMGVAFRDLAKFYFLT